jgi:Galactose-3-O-sulfotransferase
MVGSAREAQLGEIQSLTRELAETTRISLGRVRDARGELPPQTSLVAFVHIPKTGGGTVIQMFSQAYSRSKVTLHDAGNYLAGPDKAARKLSRREGGWLQWERQGGRVTAGHVPYALFRQYLPQGTRYMTFLREPVDRVVSHYHQHLQPLGDTTPRATSGKKRSAASIVEALEASDPRTCNLATRLLCGHPARTAQLSDGALEDAKANLRGFAFVGLQERFEESMVLLQRMLGLDLTPYVNRHVTVGRPLVEDLSDEERRLIREHNELDSELYEFAQELFDEAVASAGDRFAAEAERLRAMAAEANDEALRRARELLDRELPVGASKLKTELFEAARQAGIPIAALKYVSKFGVSKHGEGSGGDREKIWTRTG